MNAEGAGAAAAEVPPIWAQQLVSKVDDLAAKVAGAGDVTPVLRYSDVRSWEPARSNPFPLPSSVRSLLPVDLDSAEFLPLVPSRNLPVFFKLDTLQRQKGPLDRPNSMLYELEPLVTIVSVSEDVLFVLHSILSVGIGDLQPALEAVYYYVDLLNRIAHARFAVIESFAEYGRDAAKALSEKQFGPYQVHARPSAATQFVSSSLQAAYLKVSAKKAAEQRWAQDHRPAPAGRGRGRFTPRGRGVPRGDAGRPPPPAPGSSG